LILYSTLLHALAVYICRHQAGIGS